MSSSYFRDRFFSRTSIILLVFSFILVLGYCAVFVVVPGFEASVQQVFDRLRQYAMNNGLWGMFLFALAANATILINIPYSAAAVLLAALGLNPFVIAGVAAVGAFLGEVVAYLVGYGGSTMLSKERLERLASLKRLIATRRRYVDFLIFFIAAVPIPDDILLVPLGVIRYPFQKLIVPMLAGKFIQNFYFALIGTYSLASGLILGGHSFSLGLASLTCTLALIYVIVMLDWEKVFNKLIHAGTSSENNPPA